MAGLPELLKACGKKYLNEDLHFNKLHDLGRHESMFQVAKDAGKPIEQFIVEGMLAEKLEKLEKFNTIQGILKKFDQAKATNAGNGPAVLEALQKSIQQQGDPDSVKILSRLYAAQECEGKLILRAGEDVSKWRLTLNQTRVRQMLDHYDKNPGQKLPSFLDADKARLPFKTDTQIQAVAGTEKRALLNKAQERFEGAAEARKHVQENKLWNMTDKQRTAHQQALDHVQTKAKQCGDEKCELGNRRTPCFPAGMRVTMGDGALLPIEEVLPGMRLLSWDTAGHKSTSVEVECVTNKYTSEIVDLGTSGGHSILTTPDHPFYLPTLDTWASANGWYTETAQLASTNDCYVGTAPQVLGNKLEVGSVLLADGLGLPDDTDGSCNGASQKEELDEVTKLDWINLEDAITVYSLTVGGEHCYFVERLLVHNSCAMWALAAGALAGGLGGFVAEKVASDMGAGDLTVQMTSHLAAACCGGGAGACVGSFAFPGLGGAKGFILGALAGLGTNAVRMVFYSMRTPDGKDCKDDKTGDPLYLGYIASEDGTLKPHPYFGPIENPHWLEICQSIIGVAQVALFCTQAGLLLAQSVGAGAKALGFVDDAAIAVAKPAAQVAGDVLAVAGGAVAVGAGLLEIGFAINGLVKGSDIEQNTKHLVELIREAMKAKPFHLSPAQKKVYGTMKRICNCGEKLKEDIIAHYRVVNVGKIESGGLGAAGGICFILAPFTAGATLIPGFICSGGALCCTGVVAVAEHILSDHKERLEKLARHYQDGLVALREEEHEGIKVKLAQDMITKFGPRAYCVVERCFNESWNGKVGEACCRTCADTKGGKHGPSCRALATRTCGTSGCCRAPWNGHPMSPCCRTCEQTHGEFHGPQCETRYEAGPAGSATCTSSGCRRRPWNSQSGQPDVPRSGRKRSCRTESRVSCTTDGCDRAPWNGELGQSCCRSCGHSNGSSHGKECQAKFDTESLVSCTTDGCDRAPWNGELGQSCCRSCGQSNGSSHGKECQAKFDTESLVSCTTDGCDRAPWNGELGQSCCRSCAQSNGSSHGKECQAKFNSRSKHS